MPTEIPTGNSWRRILRCRRDHAERVPERRHQPRAAADADQPELVWGLIASLYIGNVMLLILNLPLVGLWAKMLTIPQPLLYGGILVFATIGTYRISQSPMDLVLLYSIGALGYVMRRFDFPTAPVIIGLILGPLAEQEFRRAMTISQGDLTVFVTHPIAASLLALAAIALAAPFVMRMVKRERG